MSEHLAPLDATFLELEEADEGAHMHIGVIMVFDARPGGASPSREEVCQYLTSRLGQVPRYSRRLSEPHTGAIEAKPGERLPPRNLAAVMHATPIPSCAPCDSSATKASSNCDQAMASVSAPHPSAA
jgi:diacylglycerol O-acyltransferase / wax synthase